MTRSTRSKQTLSNVEVESKTKTKKIASNNVKEAIGTKTRSNSKKILQDENAVPVVENTKTGKSISKPHVLSSTLHSKNKENSATRRSTVLALKSPVLRDRTNTTNELIKNDLSTMKTNEKQLNKNKKLAKKGPVKKLAKHDVKLSCKAQVSIKNYLTEQQPIQKENSKVTRNTKNKKALTEEKNSKSIEKLECQNLSLQKKVIKKVNISEEALEKLLNEEEDQDDNNEKPSAPKEKMNKNGTQNSLSDKNDQASKKFFKNKRIKDDTKLNTVNKKNTRLKINLRKKGVVNKKTVDDSSFNVTLEEQRKSTILPEKKLRPRAAKNYCDESKLSQDSTDKKLTEAENPVINNHQKGLPIYKTITLSQDSIKDKEVVYEFPEDSQEKIQTGKKRKKTTKKPTVKRAKKTRIPPPVTAKKEQKKSLKKIAEPIKDLINSDQNDKHNSAPTNKKQTKKLVNIEQSLSEQGVDSNFEVPEYVDNENGSVIQEASTIKIISDEKLEGSRRINLTATPPVPKTITSELKLFGPKNVITSQPTTKYNNMINHSLIRKSMSPIKRLDDQFDPGSPWRAVEPFSRVHKMVQSTPQINRLPLIREKKLPMPAMNLLNKHSISSEDTILVSSKIENKTSPKENNGSEINMKENIPSPRKFGTIVSNINSCSAMQTKSIQSNKNVSENNQTPLKNISEQSTLIVDNELPEMCNENQQVTSSEANKENNTPSPKKSPIYLV